MLFVLGELRGSWKAPDTRGDWLWLLEGLLACKSMDTRGVRPKVRIRAKGTLRKSSLPGPGALYRGGVRSCVVIFHVLLGVCIVSPSVLLRPPLEEGSG